MKLLGCHMYRIFVRGLLNDCLSRVGYAASSGRMTYGVMDGKGHFLVKH